MNLRAYLAICDANYTKLDALLAAFPSPAPTLTVMHFRNDLDGLAFETRPLGEYTSAIEISHRAQSPLPALRVSVRAYHDLQTSEVIAFRSGGWHGDRSASRRTGSTPVSGKIQTCRFLGELLEFCLGETDRSNCLLRYGTPFNPFAPPVASTDST